MTVSIIMPARNAESFIVRSLMSAIRAGARVPGGVEILAVDNGSTDRTAQIIESFQREYPSVVTGLQCAMPGAPAARNHGIANSSGDWLQFLDADDTISENKIAHQLSIANDAAWIVGAYRHLYTDGTTENSIPHQDLWKGLFHNYRTGCTHSNLFRRSAIIGVGGWDERLTSNQDPALCFQLLKAQTPFVIDAQINSYYHHHHGGQRITSSDGSQRWHHRIQMLAAANAYLIDHRPVYWHDNAPYFLGALLRAIRILATYDLGAAIAAYRAYFGRPNEWAIDRPYELLPYYTRLYPYLGFQNLERLRLALSGLPQSWKDKLKS